MKKAARRKSKSSKRVRRNLGFSLQHEHPMYFMTVVVFLLILFFGVFQVANAVFATP